LEKDAHGNLQLGGGALADHLTQVVKDRLGYKRVRGDTFGYVQRSFAGCVSDVDQREAREVGHKAVQYAMSGKHSGSVTIHRTGSYAADYELSPLEDIAAKTRKMPDDFIAGSGTHVTEAFHHYLKPLLGAGLPQMHRLCSPAVPKLLKPD
jgi:6-phosphofructokinase 1